MRWTWKLGTFAGIVVNVHATFLLLVAWVALAYWVEAHSVAAVLDGIVFTLLLFVCVVVHEFGHAFAARAYGIRTRDILLLPIGGVSHLERIPSKPAQEFWVAVAGPATSAAIAVVLFVVAVSAAAFQPVPAVGVAEGPMVERLMLVNILLAVFNMLPAFPMDGGRVLRALLAMRFDYAWATHIAAAVGQGLALLFGIIGLFYNPFLVFIALFVWIGASQESGMAQMKAAIGGVPVAAAMRTDIAAVAPGDSLARARDLVLHHGQHDTPVVSGGRVVGVLTRQDLLRGLAADPQAAVGDHMHRTFETADVSEMLDAALARLQTCECQALPVVDQGRLVGLINMEAIGEFLRLHAALRPHAPSTRGLGHPGAEP
jgi:Zn-dependent protease/CBS domain-containing protein